MSKKPFLIVIILLTSFALRIYHLTDIPPGLTHDEANHGREALGILNGIFLLYFPLNYGSEPLYSYTVAGSMLALGKNLLALRWVNVVSGLAAITITYRWAVGAFDRRTALLVAALMAVSFWPLATSRQALRAGLLPFFMGIAIWFFWLLVRATGDQRHFNRLNTALAISSSWPAVGFGLSVAITLHIYLAARVAWLIFPVFLLYLALVHRPIFYRVWRPALAGLALAALLVTPMFFYLQNHPEALTRLEMLDRPLQELRAGRLGLVLHNAASALLAFIWPGYGDSFLAYNVPGRPVFDAVTAAFFIIGTLVSLLRWRQPAHAFLLIWFAIGIMPSLITGATANTTRNLAALAAAYVLAAVGFVAIADWLAARWRWLGRTALAGTAALWLLFVGFTTARDYFLHWGQSAAVRGAYQHTLIEMLGYLEQASTTQSDLSFASVVISSVYPGPAHDPSIGLVLTAGSDLEIRWVDARYALLVPPDPLAHLVIPVSTPPHAAFRPLLASVETVVLRPDDQDPGFTVYTWSEDPLRLWPPDEAAVNFGNAVFLLHAHWLKPAVGTAVGTGETAELLTVWQVLDPSLVGPVVPPTFTTDVVLFTQLLDEMGNVFAQRDSLEAPSWNWRPGDVVVQVHPITIPADTISGTYQAIVGLYDRQSGKRLTVLDVDGNPVDTYALVMPLQVVDR